MIAGAISGQIIGAKYAIVDLGLKNENRPNSEPCKPGAKFFGL
jgi:hypothetical protein